jgi:hypothetical protein
MNEFVRRPPLLRGISYLSIIPTLSLLFFTLKVRKIFYCAVRQITGMKFFRVNVVWA